MNAKIGKSHTGRVVASTSADDLATSSIKRPLTGRVTATLTTN